MKNGMGSWNGSEDQVSQLENALAEDLVNDFLGPDGKGIILGNKTNKPKDPTDKPTLTEKDRLQIANNIKNTVNQRKDIAKNFSSDITFTGTGANKRITNYSAFKKKLQTLGITIGSEFADQDGKVHTLELKGLGYTDSVDFRNMDAQTLELVIENLQGGMKILQPASLLP
jgi:hypothetical protein